MSMKRTFIILATLALLVIVVLGAWTFYDAYQLGVLPWQAEPTRAAVTPFANLPTVVATPEG